MKDLFGEAKPVPPLAEALRPQSLDEVVGQSHLLAPGKPLRLAFDSGKPHSMILWGPPGVGKTTLARLMTGAFDAEFIALSAVLSGVKDIKEAVERAKGLRLEGIFSHPGYMIGKNKDRVEEALDHFRRGLVAQQLEAVRQDQEDE